MNSRRLGHAVLVSAGFALGFHFWLNRGAFLTLQSEGEGPDYLFISASVGSLIALLVLGCAALFVVHLIIRRVTSRHGATNPTMFTLEDVAWSKPLLLLWVSALGPLTVLSGVGRLLSVLSFFVVDLRWWWTPIVVVTTAFAIYRRLHSPSIVRLIEFQVPRFAPEVALAAICGLCAVAWTPNLRFSAEVHGDEPRYLRYCENFYQGNGLEISSVRPIADLPSDFNSRFGRNLLLVAETLPGELTDLMSDARLFLSDPAHRFVRSETSGGFIRGKTGGVYQKHQPGLSLLMLPAYYIDRSMTPVEPGSSAQWPGRLIAVNTFFLALYLVWIVLIFRFVRHLIERAWIAWLTALTIGLTMPVVAFPFQMYAEVPAGVLLFIIAGHLLFSAHTTPAASLFVGVLTGYLPWLHVRFSALAAVLVIAGIVALRRDSRRLFSFLAGFVIPLIFLALYSYRLTGSVLPSAIWHDEDNPALSSVGALRGSVGYLIDSQRGLFAHSPIYLLALPGYWLLAKHRRDIAWLCLFVFLSVLLPAAAHTFSGAMTPNRLIVAVVPFAAIPIAVVIARYAHSRAFQAVFVVLLVLSVQNAWAYNWSHLKHVSRMIDRSFSGWKVNLLFPAESRTPWGVSNANGWLYVAWVAVLIGLLFAPALVARLRLPRRSRAKAGHREWNLHGFAWARESAPRLMLVLTLLIVVLGTTVAASTGVWDKRDFRMPAASTARRAAGLLDAMGGCVLCLSSTGGRVTTDQAFSHLVLLAPSLATRGRAVGRDYAEWLQMPGRIRAWYVEANGREPSSEDIGHYLFQWREERSRPEDIRRRIFRSSKKVPPP